MSACDSRSAPRDAHCGTARGQAAQPGSPGRLGRLWRRPPKRSSDTLAAYVFLAPALIGFTAFVVYPLFRSGYFALTTYNGLTDPTFVGLDNFHRMFTTDPSFWPSVRATLLLVVLYVPLSLIIGLALAVFCNQRVRGVGLLRTLCYLPVVLPVVATITLWKFVFNPQVGLANQVLKWFHLPTSEWLSGDDSAMPSIVIVMLWSVGSTMIIFLAALQAVPTELYEAARLDGMRLPHGVLPDHPAADQPDHDPPGRPADGDRPPGLQPAEDPLAGQPGRPRLQHQDPDAVDLRQRLPRLGQVSQFGYASAQVWVLFLVIVVVIAATARFSSIWTYSDHVS